MKKIILILVSFLLVPLLPVSADGIDVVVMVDTSESMFPYFDDLVNYLLRDLLENWLHKEDAFHLLSFAESPEVEVSGRIEKPADLSAIIDRILLLKPLGLYTDLVDALDYLYSYVSTLPPQNKKLVLLLTDGVHDPPPASPNKVEPQSVLSMLLKNAERIRLQGWDIHILQTPGGGTPGAAKAEFLQAFAEKAGAQIVPYSQGATQTLTEDLTGFPTLEFPGHLGAVSRKFVIPFRVNNPSNKDVQLNLIRLKRGKMNLLAKTVRLSVPANQSAVLSVPIRLPFGFPLGEHDLSVKLTFSDEGLRIAPLGGSLAFTYSTPSVFGALPAYLFYPIIALAVLIIAMVLVIALKNRARDLSFSSFFQVSFSPGGKKPAHRPVIMRVALQNPYIGSRNIHAIPPKAYRSVGGDGSSFLIYYVPMAKRIGFIHNDGKQYIFIPRKLEYFPDLQKPLHDCLNKEIQALSTKGHQVRFAFQEYVSPLEAINRLLRSVKRVTVEGR